MRRRDKYIASGAAIAAGLTVVVDVLLQWLEHREQGKEFTWESYNGIRTLKSATVAGAIGAGAGYALYCYQISEEEKIPFNSDEYLKRVLSEEHLKTNPELFQRMISVREKLKQWFVDSLGEKLVALPQDTGSFYKGTAIVSNYDLDIILPFKKNSFESLEEMYNHVFDVVGKEFSKSAIVTKQTKAIRLSLNNDTEDPIHIDIVPGREINDYAKERNLNLFVRPNWGWWDRGSSFKTNTRIQQEITINNPSARAVIKLLKAYRDRNGLPLPTIMIDQCVVDALSDKCFGTDSSITENLLNSMDHIADKMELKSIVDIANSNNNLHDKLSDLQRRYIYDQLKGDIQKIEDNPRYIKEVFEC